MVKNKSNSYNKKYIKSGENKCTKCIVEQVQSKNLENCTKITINLLKSI